MTEPVPPRRLEETDDGRLRVVVRNYGRLWSDYPGGRQNVLTQEFEDLWTYGVPKKGGPERVRVGSAALAGEADGWFIHGANGIFAEVPLRDRELTDAERAYCEDHLVLRDVETVLEFVIPHPEDLRSAILDQDLGRFDCLDAVIPDHERRHDALTELQERIAEEGVRANRLSRDGFPIDLDPVWDPEDGHNDDLDANHLHDMASMRTDAHLSDWYLVAGFPYASFRNTRLRVLGIYEHDLEPREIPPLDVAGYPEWSYCQLCGAAAPDEQFLRVDLERRDGTKRVCDPCGDRQADWDHAVCYTPENVGAAKDERAQRLGGQRTLMGEYDGE